MPKLQPLANQPQSQQPPKESLAQLLDKYEKFPRNLIAYFYSRNGLPNEEVFQEFEELQVAILSKGGTEEDLRAADCRAITKYVRLRHLHYKNLIAEGRMPAVPECPDYYKLDRPTSWEIDWFDRHIEMHIDKPDSIPLLMYKSDFILGHH